ncbi:hypothetical protein BGZ65_006688, partial [Modicella reniformis]
MHISGSSSPEGSPPRPSALPLRPLQHFYSPVLGHKAIQAYLNPSSNEAFILWSQIQDSFNTVAHIRGASFMVDDSNEVILPLRIPYYQDVELEVVLAHEMQPKSHAPLNERASPLGTQQKSFTAHAAVSQDPYVAVAPTQPPRATTTTDDGVSPFATRLHSLSLDASWTAEFDEPFEDDLFNTLIPSAHRERPTAQVDYNDVNPLPLTPEAGSERLEISHQSDTPTSCVTEEVASDVDGTADQPATEEPTLPQSGPLLTLDADSYLMQTELGRALEQYSAKLTLGNSFMQGYKGLFALFVQDFLAGEYAGAESLKHLMTGLLMKVLGEMDRDNAVNMRERSLELQHEAIVRLGSMQSRVQVLMTKSYKLFEDTIPRLFIILRVGTQKLDRVNSANNKFRFYFLCECGKHTEESTPLASSSKHQIHMAQHKGYDITRPNTFLAKYGPYVLTIMEMLRYGITADEFVVPSMAHLDILDEGDSLSSHDIERSSFQSNLDDTMDYIRGQLESTPNARNISSTDIMKQSVLEDYELRRMETFLEQDENPRPFGDMYKIVTPEGFVKWVCGVHFRGCHRAKELDYLRRVIDHSIGKLNEQDGSATITCRSASSALEFYTVLERTRGVYALEMNFGWDASKTDVRMLCDAVMASNVSILSLRGLTGQERSLNDTHRESRLGPLTLLMDDGKLQALLIEGSELLDSGLGLGGIPVSGLRKLQLGLGKFSKDIQNSFFRLLQRLTDLVDLRLDCVDLDQAYDILKRQFGSLRLPHLSMLTLATPGNLVWLNQKARTMAMFSICPGSKRMIEDHEDLTTIYVPFQSDKLASTISWFERQYGHRHQPPVITFST